MSSKPNKRGGRGPLPRPVMISKKLSWLLRHGAEKEGLQLDGAGYVNLASVLSNRNFASLKVSFEEIRQVVAENEKQRFSLIPATATATEEELPPPPTTSLDDPKEWKIRANQGHSLKIDSEGLLEPITTDNMPETVVHGTTHAAWPLILASGGLKPMGRTHVHFAAGLPAGFTSVVDSDDGGAAVAAPVISGMRNSSTVLIFVDIGKAMAAGLKFWRSDNGVVLTEGNENGMVLVEFFKRVEDRTGDGVLVEDGKVVKETPKHWGGGGGKKGKK